VCCPRHCLQIINIYCPKQKDKASSDIPRTRQSPLPLQSSTNCIVWFVKTHRIPILTQKVTDVRSHKYAIRLVVYMNTTANSDEEQILTKRHNLSQHHVQHCFDLLRQTLMCNADTTLQPYSPRIKGVTPWGYPRICKDYDQIVEFAELYRTTDRDGFGE
jgi:hypothetical protein